MCTQNIWLIFEYPAHFSTRILHNLWLESLYKFWPKAVTHFASDHADRSHEGSYIYGRLIVLWFLSNPGLSRYSWNPIVASVNSVMASTSSISNPTLCWTYNLFKYQSSSFCFSLIRGIVGITSAEAARGIVLDIYSSQTVALCGDMGVGIRGSIVGVATVEWSGGIVGTTMVPFKKPLASSRHVTWRIKGTKILDILPGYPANMYRFYGTFFVWRCTELFRIRRKVTMPRVAEYLVGICSFEYP